MELFLLLSALIASLTGTGRQMMPSMPGMVQAQRALGERASDAATSAKQALERLRLTPRALRPDGYVAPDVFAPHDAELPIRRPHASARRRE